MNPAMMLRQALVEATVFEAQAEVAGNVTCGRGAVSGRKVRMAFVDNRIASGAIGTLEAERLGSIFQVARAEKVPVILFLDSAGAKVSEGLKALGAFRALYREGLQAAFAGIPIVAVLGRNCFGGSSMLAHLATHRLFAPNTQLAMSGPAVIASSAGMNALDEMFRAMAEAAMSAAARSKANPANTCWSEGFDLASWLAEAIGTRPKAEFLQRHESLAARSGKPWPAPSWESVTRRDLEKLYPQGYEAREGDGILQGTGQCESAPERFIGLVGKSVLGAGRAWNFSQLAWALLGDPPARLTVFLDCASHAARLDDERLVLTEYIVDMGLSLAALSSRGTKVELAILGKAGGGVYVALAAPATQVASLHGADIQVLPGAAVAAILGESNESAPDFNEYRKSGVADEEIRLGLVPGNA